MKKLLLFVFIFCGIISKYAYGWDGTGSSSTDPYLIKTVVDLQQLAQNVNNGTSYSGIFFRLESDLDLAGYTWMPIGLYVNYDIATTENTNNKPFSGSFDGNYHTIKNLRISANTTGSSGLFGYVKDGTIENLVIEGGKVTGGKTTDNLYSFEGAIVGFFRNMTPNNFFAVQNCYNIDCEIVGGNGINDYAGGIVGMVQCGDPLSVDGYYITSILTCRNTASINPGNTSGSTTLRVYGGIAGLVSVGHAGSAYTSLAEIIDCANEGSIKGGTDPLAVEFMGGIVGRTDLTSMYAGIGKIYLKNCSNDGNVKMDSNDPSSYLGGIAGVVETGAASGDVKATEILHCYNYGEVFGSYSGGAIGRIGTDNVIDGCYWRQTGTVNASLNAIYNDESFGQHNAELFALNDAAFQNPNSFINWSVNADRVWAYPTLDPSRPRLLYFMLDGTVTDTLGYMINNGTATIFKLSGEAVQTINFSQEKFVSNPLPGGRYYLKAQSSGYLAGYYYPEPYPPTPGSLYPASPSEWTNADTLKIAFASDKPNALRLVKAATIVPGTENITIKGVVESTKELKSTMARPVAYATVILYGKAKSKSTIPSGYEQLASTVTDADGMFSFGILPMGDYLIRVDMPGYNMTIPTTINQNNSANGQVFDLEYLLDVDNKTIDLMSSLSSKKTEAETNLKIYPNPANDLIKVTVTNDVPYVVRIFNSLGQQLSVTNSTVREVTIDVSGLRDGIYFVRVEQQGKVHASKLIIKK